MLLLSVGLLGGSVRYALDEVRAVAKGAWSVRRLRAVYRGPAIRVRRASDGREQDVGFDGSGNLDVPALSRFCGASEGSVSIWYDQSGLGQDLSQAAPGNQPGVFAAGEVRKLGNAAAKPGFAFTAAAHNFLTNTQFSLGGASFAACSVASRTANIPIDGRLVSFTAAGSTVDYNSNQSVIMSLYDSGQIRGHRNGV